MVSMNNILQVSSRSSLALPRRKLSNSRQVIPLRSLECSKSCSERFIVNGKKHAKKKRHTLQSRWDCNHKLTLMPCHQDCDCVSSDFFFYFFVSPFLYFFFFSSGERFCQRQVHQPGWYHPSSCRDSGWWMCKHYWGDHHSNSLCRWTQRQKEVFPSLMWWCGVMKRVDYSHPVFAPKQSAWCTFTVPQKKNDTPVLL